VEGGKQFSEAIAKHPKLFNPLYMNMVRASEMSGSFAEDAGPHRGVHRASRSRPRRW
jgi:type II secretory pathway component PulF